MNIHSDQPIQSIGDDRFGRARFAENLSDAIMSWKNKESICLALHGSWGAGKTSVINMCMEFIRSKAENSKETEQPIIMRFQPWVISEQVPLIMSFLRQLKVTLNHKTTSDYARTAAKQLERYEKVLNNLKLIPGVSEYLGAILTVVTELKGMSNALVDNQDIDGSKEELCKALEQLPAPVIIVIDDIDRLPVREIRQVFQLIKAVADFPRTIYLLSFDPELVRNTLNDLQPNGQGTYLEKIVQLNFEIPELSSSAIAAYLLQELTPFLSSLSLDSEDTHRWNDIKFGSLPYLFKNAREVKRFTNMVNFRYPLIKDEVNELDMLMMEALRMFSPDLYGAIKSNASMLLSDSIYGSFEKDEREQSIQQLVGLAPKNIKRQVEILLKHLFPEVMNVIDKYGIAGLKSEWDKSRRICLAPYFDYYFSTTIDENEVSNQEAVLVYEAINDAHYLEQAFRLYFEDGRILRLLPKFQALASRDLEVFTAITIISALCEASEGGLEKPPKKNYEMPLSWAILKYIYEILQAIPANQRAIVLDGVFSKLEKSLDLPIEIAESLWRQWHPRKNDEEGKYEKILTQKEAEHLKDIALAMILRSKDDGRLLHSKRMHYILYVWDVWGGGEMVKDWTDKLLANERNIPAFLLGAGSYVTTHSGSASYSTTSFRINPESLKWLCNVEKLKETCERLLNDAPQWMVETERTIILTFLEGFKTTGW